MKMIKEELNAPKIYSNTLNGFKCWAKDNPPLFNDNNVSEPRYYKDKNGLYVEEVWRQLPRFLGGDSIKKYRATFEYNEDTKSFQFVDGNLVR